MQLANPQQDAAGRRNVARLELHIRAEQVILL